MSLIKIETLAQAQKDAMSIHAQKWIGIGRSAGATNRAIVEPIITDFYQQIGKDAPEFIYAKSPVAGLAIANLLKKGGRVSASVRDGVYASVRSSLMASVRASVSDDVRFGVLSGVMDIVMDIVWSSVNVDVLSSVSDSVLSSDSDNVVMDSVRDNAWYSDGDTMRASARDDVRTGALSGELQYHQFFFGSHDVEWLAFYSYFSEYVNDIYTDEQKRALQQWTDLNANCGWWYPFEGVCVICDRPEYTLIDEAGRLL